MKIVLWLLLPILLFSTEVFGRIVTISITGDSKSGKVDAAEIVDNAIKGVEIRGEMTNVEKLVVKRCPPSNLKCQDIFFSWTQNDPTKQKMDVDMTTNSLVVSVEKADETKDLNLEVRIDFVRIFEAKLVHPEDNEVVQCLAYSVKKMFGVDLLKLIYFKVENDAGLKYFDILGCQDPVSVKSYGDNCGDAVVCRDAPVKLYVENGNGKTRFDDEAFMEVSSAHVVTRATFEDEDDISDLNIMLYHDEDTTRAKKLTNWQFVSPVLNFQPNEVEKTYSFTFSDLGSDKVVQIVSIVTTSGIAGDVIEAKVVSNGQDKNVPINQKITGNDMTLEDNNVLKIKVQKNGPSSTNEMIEINVVVKGDDDLTPRKFNLS